jgi:peptidoglycan hydrolase-like protein with peptidoglycan-binding domain
LVKRRSERSAAKSDEAADAVMTGLRCHEAGDLRAAEEAYRRADAGGDAAGAFHLGRLLADRGELAAAAVAYRRAAKRGEPAAATNLGILLEQQGDSAGAASAYRRASEGGDAAGAVNLGRLLARHHDLVGAEAAYRRASALGDDGALELLAALSTEQREPAVAQNELAALDDPQLQPPRRIERVKALQAMLSYLGFDPGPADGRYGPRTTDAVTRFQIAHDLPGDGVVGPITAEALKAALNPPTSERIERVKALQRQLSLLGLEPGPVDGRYGPLTTSAVTRFQQDHGLPVDGLVGPKTADALAARADSVRPAKDRSRLARGKFG